MTEKAYIRMDILPPMDPGTSLREARQRAGLSQSELARRTHTSQATISAYESGAKRPSIATLSRLLAATGSRIEVRGPANPVRRASGAMMTERGRRLVEVLGLAEALPARPRGALSYPRLRP